MSKSYSFLGIHHISTNNLFPLPFPSTNSTLLSSGSCSCSFFFLLQPRLSFAARAHLQAALHLVPGQDTVCPAVRMHVVVDRQEGPGTDFVLVDVPRAKVLEPRETHHVCEAVFLVHHEGACGQMSVQHVAQSLQRREGREGGECEQYE